MERRELEQLADLVVESLRGREAVLRSQEGSTPGDRPVRRPVRREPAGRWETPEISWRMPVVRGRGTQMEEPTDSPAGPIVPKPIVPKPRSAIPVTPLRKPGVARMADYVDHTLLKAEATRSQIEQLCDEAGEHGFAAVCVNGAWVSVCRQRLAGTGVKIATVVSFPLGASTSETKAAEARQLVELGADELDMVAPIGHILDGDWDYVEDDIRAVVDVSKARTVKVILESAALEPLQIVKASAIAMEAGAHFVKTSTGFHAAGGATAEAVALMRLTVGDALGVKAAGGIRDCATALRMIAAGANRIGTSSGVRFVDCLGTGPLPLSDLLTGPDRHEAVCKTGDCGMY